MVNVTFAATNVQFVGNDQFDTTATRVVCYSAADAQELLRSGNLALQRFIENNGPLLGDSQLVGASQGTKYMGMLVSSFAFL